MTQKEESVGPDGQMRRVCRVCSQEPECLPWDLDPAELHGLGRILEQPPPLNGGDHLFQAGDSLGAVYAVRRGAFKSYSFDAHGRRHVLGFTMPGELIGFEGISIQRHGSNAVALTESVVCALPYAALTALMGPSGRLRRTILRSASIDFAPVVDNDPESDPGARLAAFFLNLVERRLARARLKPAFDLPMSSEDIADYLQVETVALAEALDRLEARKIIMLDGCTLHVTDPLRLKDIAQNGAM